MVYNNCRYLHATQQRSLFMANMKDIAARANVSIATVSKVLNGQGNVAPETIRLVTDIANELNYRPNLYARNLKKGQSHAIGIITEDITVFNSSAIVDGIGACCDERGYHYFLENLRLNRLNINPLTDFSSYSKIVSDAVSFVSSMQVDGVIYLSCHSHTLVHLPFPDDLPLVCAYCNSSDPSIPSVTYNDKSAAYNVAKELIAAGHTKIGTITGPTSSPHTINRLTGFQEALFENDIPYNPKYTVAGDWGRDSGYELGKTLIDMGVTAIFAQNDLMAMGIIDYCNISGIAVGKDIALFGFDNREISTVCRPTLSTVAIPLFEIGHTSAETVFNIIENKENIETGEILLDCNLIFRESSNYDRSKQ